MPHVKFDIYINNSPQPLFLDEPGVKNAWANPN